MRLSRLLIGILFALCLTSTAQDDQQPYFSLSSNRTYAPGEKPVVQLWAQNVQSLEFRVYRVKDPIEFFRNLENVHRFGEGSGRPKRKLTWIERFHQFKRQVRAAIRDSVREQYTADARATIHGWITRPETKPAAKSTQYAAVPILNPDQVVSVWRQNVSQKERWVSENIPIEVQNKGLYLVEAVVKDLRAYTIVIVSDLALITKSAPGQVVAVAVDRKTGNPRSGVPLHIWANQSELAQTSSNQDGLVEATVDIEQSDEAMVVARHEEDFAVASLFSWYLSDEPSRFSRTYIYTDRPVYRRGHTVHWKAILRDQKGSLWQLPSLRQVDVEISDPEGKPMARTTAQVSANGTMSGDFKVPTGAALGYYSIQFHIGDSEQSGGFHVEEYRKPEYQVRVTPAERRVLQGSPIEATISARYFFGEPVKFAKVQYVVHRSRYWHSRYGDEEDEPGADLDDSYSYQQEQVLEQSGQLDGEGKLTVRIPTTVAEQNADMKYRIEARVTDEANREISGTGIALATRGRFYLEASADQYVYEKGQKARVTVQASDYDGKPVETAVRLELVRYVWGKDAVQPAPIERVEGRTDAKGAVKIEVALPESGSFRAIVRATSEGREVEDAAWIWVTGTGGSWISDRRERLQIIPDKSTYKPGDTAHVLIVTGVPNARVLVTSEGNRLFTKGMVTASGPTLSVDVPIQGEYKPNFYVNAAFIHEGQLYEGSKRLKVPAAEKQLKVDVVPSKPEFKPGEEATYTVAVQDQSGKPVAAEVSVGVVDEAIYSIRPDSAPDIFKSFYGWTENRVGTQSSLGYYFSGEAGRRSMQLARVRQGRRLAQIKPEMLVQPKVRKAFPDTAFWVASLNTDASGTGRVKFNFPDSLTTWRATARAVNPETQVGAATQQTIVRKNVMLRLSTPRFFTQGDETVVSVLVHNYLDTAKTARVSLETEGLEIMEGTTRDVEVPSKGDVKVDWRLRALSVREAKLTGKALTDTESDAMELTLPVNPFGVRMSDARSGAISDTSADAGIEFTFPAEIEPSSRALEVQVTPSVAGAIFGALEYLTSFPYGCTEQTMSSFLPNILVSKALSDLNIPSKVDPGELRKKINAGLDRLYGFQHEDGGWGWWQTDESHPFMTAYVVAGLVQARSSGVEVKADAVGRGMEWMRVRLRAAEKLEPDLRAYLVYALSLGGERSREFSDPAMRATDGMTSYGLALLGLALQTDQDPRAEQMAAQLVSRAKSDGRDAYWPVEDDHLMGFHGDATAEATAHALKFLVHARPQSPLLSKAALWLVSHRDQGYYWSSTKQTAMAIYGLIDYLKQSGELKPNFSVTVKVNGRQVLAKFFEEKDALSPEAPSIRLDPSQLDPGSNRITITKSGAGRLYWSGRAEYYSTANQLQPTGSAGLGLTREYFRLIPVREGGKITYDLAPQTGRLAPGDVIVVRLSLTGSSWRYLAIEDPIPAGTEFVEKDELYEIRNRPPWWRYSYTRREFHDDRAAIFQTWFENGRAEHMYLLKVVNPGSFRVSPARVQPMYQPQYLATSDSRQVEVQ